MMYSPPPASSELPQLLRGPPCLTCGKRTMLESDVPPLWSPDVHIQGLANTMHTTRDIFLCISQVRLWPPHVRAFMRVCEQKSL